MIADSKPSQRMREQDPFLSDPDNLEYEIHCVDCKSPLWRTKILKRFGMRVASTETVPCDPAVKDFDKHRKWCDICGRRFYALARNGGQMYLIKDLNCGITRLI